MADSDALKEFFIRLGFKIDSTSQSKFMTAVKNSDNAILALSASVAAATLATGVFVDKMASSMEKLYFASRRTGASAAQIEDFSLSLQNAGGSAQGALSALEALASFTRRNPGGNAFLMQQGVKKEHLGNAEQELEDLRERWVEMKKHGQMAQAISVASVLGIDENTLVALTSDDYKKSTVAEDTAKKFGFNLQDATKGAHEFEESLRELGVEVTTVGQWIESSLNEPMKGLIGWTEKAINSFQRFLEITNKSGVTKALKDQGVPDSVAEFLGTETKLDTHWYDFSGAKTALGAFGKMVNSQLSNASWASNPKTKEAIEFFMSKEGGSFSQAQSTGIVSNLIDESGLNPAAVGDNGEAQGLAQWHSNRRGGKDITGLSFKDQLRMVAKELNTTESDAANHLRENKTAQGAGSDFSEYYERPAGIGTSSARGIRAGGLNREFSQTNNINISGVSNPKEVKDTISSAIGDKTSQAMRSFVGTPQ